MAIVREFIARNGVHVKIADDMYAHLTPEEHEARKRQINHNIWKIIIDAEIKKQRMAAEGAIR